MNNKISKQLEKFFFQNIWLWNHFFQNCVLYMYTHIFNTHLYYLESFKKEKIMFIYVNPCPVNIHFIISTAKTDISNTYRTFL